MDTLEKLPLALHWPSETSALPFHGQGGRPAGAFLMFVPENGAGSENVLGSSTISENSVSPGIKGLKCSLKMESTSEDGRLLRASYRAAASALVKDMEMERAF